METNLKKFLKTISCNPNNLNKKDFEIFSSTLNKEEILHLILLVANIKSRTQLTYLSEAIHEIMKDII